MDKISSKWHIQWMLTWRRSYLYGCRVIQYPFHRQIIVAIVQLDNIFELNCNLFFILTYFSLPNVPPSKNLHSHMINICYSNTNELPIVFHPKLDPNGSLDSRIFNNIIPNMTVFIPLPYDYVSIMKERLFWLKLLSLLKIHNNFFRLMNRRGRTFFNEFCRLLLRL